MYLYQNTGGRLKNCHIKAFMHFFSWSREMVRPKGVFKYKLIHIKRNARVHKNVSYMIIKCIFYRTKPICSLH